MFTLGTWLNFIKEWAESYHNYNQRTEYSANELSYTKIKTNQLQMKETYK